MVSLLMEERWGGPRRDGAAAADAARMACLHQLKHINNKKVFKVA
jgi:hypothetical protein